MIVISVRQYPNRAFVAHAPGSTNWNRVSVPAQVPVMSFAGVLMKSRATGAATDGSPFLVNWDQASAPSDGCFVSGSGQALDLSFNQNVWLKLTTSTDTVTLLFYW